MARQGKEGGWEPEWDGGWKKCVWFGLGGEAVKPGKYKDI